MEAVSTNMTYTRKHVRPQPYRPFSPSARFQRPNEDERPDPACDLVSSAPNPICPKRHLPGGAAAEIEVDEFELEMYRGMYVQKVTDRYTGAVIALHIHDAHRSGRSHYDCVTIA
jgi:hypothetical protein